MDTKAKYFAAAIRHALRGGTFRGGHFSWNGVAYLLGVHFGPYLVDGQQGSDIYIWGGLSKGLEEPEPFGAPTLLFARQGSRKHMVILKNKIEDEYIPSLTIFQGL